MTIPFQQPVKILMIIAGVLLLGVGGLAAWLGRDVLNPVRTVTLSATGPSKIIESHAVFKTPSVSGGVGQPINLPVYLDSSGGSVTTISAEIQYSPVDMSMELGSTAESVCSAVTRQQHDVVGGRFIVQCAVHSTNGGQIVPFLTFVVTPRRAGGLPVELIGRISDYAVVTAQ